MKNTNSQNLLILLLATFLISTSGPLGKFIDLPVPVIIWWRVAIAALVLFVLCKYQKFNLALNSKKDYTTIGVSALLFGGHLITYFYALKLSNVALGMLSLFTFPVITALLEPIFSKTKLNVVHVFLGVLVLIGLYILAPDFNFENSYFKGILFGIASALCYAIRNLIMKNEVKKYNGVVLNFYQLAILSIILSPFLFTLGTSNISTQYPYILMLAILTTAIGHTLLIRSFKHFSVSTASIINGIQPVFGIVIAYFFLNETPNQNTFIGGGLILITVIVESIRSKKQ
ncbi:multidrug transporter [Tamlana nanhaiensis]|uniref:Multidrug transporter n=1 Tax=Neotamlana nanhaiensis TaxID=1382798 RepID=A0A0D7VW03_9FLAO|nr:DMT family transporter [Tamlana nanhaiensis]KJD31060.1 multidrug transporter [Tamlana nanhaiensis]